MNEPATLKRPKPGDREEDLFRLQDEFVMHRQEPSTKVVNLQAQNKQKKGEANVRAAPGNTEPSGRILSKFAERKALKQQEKLSTVQLNGPMRNPEVLQILSKDNAAETMTNQVKNLPLDPSNIILGNIVEKNHTMTKMADVYRSEPESNGFPEVFLVDLQSSTDGGSLFWQKVSKKLKPSESLKISGQKSLDSFIPQLEDSLKQEIHQSNVEKLSQMTTEEILQGKSELESTLSPDILKFLKAKKNSTAKFKISSPDPQENVKKMEMDQIGKEITDNKVDGQKANNREKEENPIEEVVVKMECDTHPIEKETPVGELLEQATAKGWVHMDTIEPEKLEWMTNVAPAKSDDPPLEEPYNARFDFNGVLLPFRDDNLSVDKGLHHHGEEPERPGYSLQELLQLSRSSTQQQRCTALTTLANIMEKSRKGWYDKVLYPSPLVALNEKNILLLLRFSLDDTSVAVVTVTLQAMRAFLYSEADEICLDRLVGWRYTDGKYEEPELSAPKNDVIDTSNLKDHELAQLDTVAAAMRSDIVLRIRYILNEMHPPPVGVTAALDILTRLARQSSTTALNIACTSRLLDTVVRNFTPLSTDRSILENGIRDAYGVPSATAVRFFRVLVSYAGKPVADRLNNLQIVHSLLSYATRQSTAIGIRLSIESLRLWKLMLSHNVALDSIGGARLAFVSQLQLLVSTHDLGSSSELACEHASALIDVAAYEASLKTIISTLLTKWSIQLSTISSPTWSQTKLVAQTLIALGDISAFKCSWTTSTKIFASLCCTSNLLSGCTPASERDPPPLPNLGVLTQDGLLQPAVSVNSCIPFLATWINLISNTSNTTDFQIILDNPDFVKYVRRLSSNDWSLESSWFTRAELFLATGIVRAGIRFCSIANEYASQVILKIAIKLVSTLPADASRAVKEILQIVLSNERVTVEKLSNDLKSLKLENNSDKVTELLNLPNNLSSIYEEYVSSNGSWDQAALPKDWLYLPLVAAYTNYKIKMNWNDRDTTKILVLLSLESSMPEFSQNLSPSLRFSRLILVYLCDTIYLNEDVSALLNHTMTLLVKKYYKRLDFTSDLPGLSSFTDLFTSLCESFCANSYGNDSFSMALLVPLAQRHDVHYRKLLWSEHAGALRYLRLTAEKLAMPLSEYLYPVEEDPTLIESYLTALVRGTVKSAWCPLMHRIAMHHSAMFLRENNKLAVRMRTKIGQLRDRELSSVLLNYCPAET